MSVGQLNSTNPVVSLLLCLANGSGLSVFSFMVVLPKGALPLWKCLVLDGSVHNIPEFVLTPGVLHTYFLPRLVHCCVKIECILHAQTGRAGWPDAKND